MPLFGDMPILGWLFKQREDFETGRELVVFMTPSILKTDGGPGRGRPEGRCGGRAFRFLTAGESHGEALTAVIDGLPAGLPLTEADINGDLARRQRGYGRGGRMKIERDQVHISAGVRVGPHPRQPAHPDHPATATGRTGSRPWRSGCLPPGASPKTITRPRPGHADLAGAMKYGHRDIRNVLERSSARETTARVAVAGVAKRLLGEFGITILSHVTEIGGVRIGPLEVPWDEIAAARGGQRGPLRRSGRRGAP